VSSTDLHFSLHRGRLGALSVAVLAIASSASRAAAQGSETPSAQQTFLTRRDAELGAGSLLLTAGLSLFDRKIERDFEDSSHAHVRVGRRLDSYFTHINETTLTLGGLLTFGAARLLHAPSVADVSLHASESVMLASLASQLIRGPLGRARPSVSPGDQYDFRFGAGFTAFDRRAFPSIHSASGFAAASAIVAETRRRDPSAVRVVAPIAYLVALTPGLSRMYLGKHWASDVLAGALIGTWAGWRVVDYSHDHGDNPIDRALLGSRAGSRSRRGTMTIGWTGTF